MNRGASDSKSSMNEVDWIKSLDRSTPPAPRMDVAAGVMRSIGAMDAARLDVRRLVDDRAFAFAAGAALLAGAVAIALALPLWLGGDPPLAGFASTLQVVLE